jgi:aldehyde:ferredoxin oxidoreductase
MTEWYRAAARGGPGAVMGSKNLKALVCRGTGPAPEVADQKKLFELIKWGRENLHLINKGSHEYGTVPGILGTGMRGSSEPVKNWYTEWHDRQEVHHFAFAAEHWIRRYWSDYGCTVSCSKLGRVKYGKRAGTIVELPDYEGGAMQGTNYGIFDINEMAFSSTRPDEQGLDLISLGTVCAFACEAVEKGILKKEDIGGIDLKWGDTDAFAKLTDLIAFRQGEIPTLLGEGVHIAAKKIGKGSEKFAVVHKGIEPGAHGVRSSKEGRGSINYAVATQGGDHCSTAGSTEGKEGESGLINDSITLCMFQGLTGDQRVEWLQAITGFGITRDDLEKTMVKRWTTMQRITNLLAGWTYKDDVNPPRWYDPLPEGPSKGMKVEKPIEQKMAQNYYAKLGWDKQGVPTTATLQQYGFEAFEGLMAPLRATA